MTALSAYLERLDAHTHAATRAASAPTRSTGPQREAWRCVLLLVVHGVESLLLLGSWACVGFGALSGRLEPAWLAAWTLALATTVPMQALSSWLQGCLTVGIGEILKRRLLIGAMAIDPDLVRRRGAGAILSEVLESGSIDELAASGGVTTLLSVLELLLALWMLGYGAAARLEMAALLIWIAIATGLILRNLRLQKNWTQQRISLTDRLVEKMAAHRTRLAQLPVSDWHSGEDAELNEYLRTSRRLDEHAARTGAILSGGYIIAGVSALMPTFLAGSASLAELAITFGSMLFASAAFTRLGAGFTKATAAWVAWGILQPVLRAAGTPANSGVAAIGDSKSPLALRARDIVFIHPLRIQPVLQGCSLDVAHGDQILLQGSSGSGKSTFASIIAGSRTASGGYVLAAGLDRHSLGDRAWRRRMVLVPQYHENHILAAPLLFNLLLGRDLPHTDHDYAQALEVCQELGLGPLIERMPAGLNQFVGDTGWRLSQGERSRIFLARALLQPGDVVLLDESLAALDPENLRQCLECIMRRAPTLIVIAHP